MTIDTGDTAWVLMSAALVLMMTTPGLALFYGGMVQKKNALTTIMHSFICMALVTVQWILVGYSLAFGPDHGGVIGGLEWAGLQGVGLEPSADYCPTVPHQAFMAFQCMFAIITPALITGAFAERMKFSAFVLFTLLTFVILKLLDATVGLRVAVEEEQKGLDLSQHAEVAYSPTQPFDKQRLLAKLDEPAKAPPPAPPVG